VGNLYGFIGPVGTRELVLISLTNDMQETLADHFQLFETQFLNGIEEVVGFDGGYTPDAHQIVEMPLINEMQELVQQIDLGAIGRDRYDPTEQPPELLRGLAWSIEEQGERRILVQNFTRAQALSRRSVLWFDGDTFSRMDQPALLLADRIDAIIQAGQIRYKKFGVLKQVFDLSEIYREATDQDIREFSQLEKIDAGDVDNLCATANKTARKLIFSISRSGILEQKTAAEIQNLAQSVDLNINIENDKVVLPRGTDLTRILKFLDHSIYLSPLTNDRWIANSRRRL
jgi:hypothetical protein